MANQKDLANGLIGTALTSAATTLVLQAGYGDSMPAVPFFLTITPAGQLSTRGNSEIVNVTARTGDTLTIQRAQKGTTARAFSIGDIVSNSIYAEGSFDSLDVNGDIYSNGEKLTAGLDINRRINITNDFISGARIEMGVGRISGANIANINFVTTFESVPQIIVSAAGGSGSSSAFAYPGGPGFADRSFGTYNQSTSGFTAQISGVAPTSGQAAMFNWIAIGK